MAWHDIPATPSLPAPRTFLPPTARGLRVVPLLMGLLLIVTGSIQAAAHPASTDYLFYVVKPNTCGEHSFSETDAQFQEDVERYNSERAARGGKSPTDC